MRASVLEGQAAGSEMHLLTAATRPVDPESGRRAIEEMMQAGAVVEAD